MTIEGRHDIEHYIKEHATEYFQSDKSGKGYICPICGSGSGVNGTGITENPKSKGHFTCWGGDCFRNADIFEIIGKQFGLTDFNEIFYKACELFRISLGDSGYVSTWSRAENRSDETQAKNEVLTKSEENFTELFRQAATNLSQTDYHRGISLDTLKKFQVGFIPDWKASPKAPTSPRLIIPLWQGGYLARDTRQNLTEQQANYKKMRVGKVRLFNTDALKQTLKPVFIVEGELDALSIIDAGGVALGLVGVANIGKLIQAVKENPPKVPLIICPDNDEKGQEAAERLAAGFNGVKFFSYRQALFPDSYKDANEFLMNDREKFISWVKNVEKWINGIDFQDSENLNSGNADSENLENEAVSHRLKDFFEIIKKNREGAAISTGFEILDEILDGGFYPGLYFLGANSSTGKTSFLLQIADNIAQAGNGVLFFSIEMSANELIARSLSRLSMINDMELYKSTKHAKTTRGILLGRYNDIERELISKSVKKYSEYWQNLIITEGIGNVGVQSIKEKTETFLKAKGKPPVIVIDYLQILAPYDLKMTDKQNTDKNVLELKRLSRDYGTPILGISSFNRESYRAPVGMASFKESGAIEYSSDVLIGLQYDGWDYRKGEKDNDRFTRLEEIRKNMKELAKQGAAQPIQAKILKNRNGLRGDLLFEFFPRFNFFRTAKRNDESRSV